ncbi:MCE family protein [Pseudoduganella sp. FT25W]|jgi:phospholipid/cholesterol/gamma-HCH transport system substrate-binding protein|uniref:MCE family protein n=1 Tax=Duganella alba TaxID=2666081 RepID=A0A6L5QQD8_9BURK|nr:MlaD family protein [Duganella alba]MRX11905.1 MCE family protein [Duganella alba]MRX20301.1 MCE family protein [Duganella alba]
MENRSHALTTGFFTITLLIAAILYGLWFNRDRVERTPYVIATAQSIPGLNPQAPIRYRGLEVGRVGSIAFDPKVAGQILVTLNINTDAPITTTTFAALGYQGVTGIAFISLDDDKVGSPLLPSSSEHPARIPLRQGFFDQLEKRGKEILTQTEEVTKRLNDLLSPENRQTILGAFSDVSETAQKYRDLPDKLQPTIDKLPALAAETQKTLHSVNALATDVNQLTTSLQAPGGPIDRVATSVERITTSVDAVAGGLELDTLPQVNSLSDDTRASMRALRKTMNKINDRPQSLIFGAPGTPPGPGEEGFAAPAK